MKKMKIKIIRKGKGKIRYFNGCDGINLCNNINNKDYFLIKNKENLNKNFIFLYLVKLNSRLQTEDAPSKNENY